MMVRHDLQQGRLVDLLPDWRPRAGIVHVVFPSRRGLQPAVRELIDFLAIRFEALKDETCCVLPEQPARDQP